MPEWICAKEALPHIYRCVMVRSVSKTDEIFYIFKGFFDTRNEWFLCLPEWITIIPDFDKPIFIVTHWMHFPEEK